MASRPLVLSKIERPLFGEILAIAERQLGLGYITEDYLSAPDKRGLCAILDGRVVAFCVTKILSGASFALLYPRVADSLAIGTGSTERLGLVASIATDPMYTGRGIASTLLSACLQYLDDEQISLTCAIGWKSGRIAHIDGMARRLGFEPIKEFPDFWREDSIAKGYGCPVCGDPPCRCSAVIYVRSKDVLQK